MVNPCMPFGEKNSRSFLLQVAWDMRYEVRGLTEDCVCGSGMLRRC